VRRLLRGSNWPVVAWAADPWQGPILAAPADLMAATSANVVACQATADATWAFTNPSAFKSPVSRRRRETLTTSR
jgi:hypothetical protein